MSHPCVTVRDLTFNWRGQSTPVIDIPDLVVRKGEQIILQGPSGSGKSTLLSLLAGVHAPDSGQIEITGTDLSALSSRKRDRFRADHIGYIFQQFNLLPYLNCLQNVALACDFSPRRTDNLDKKNISIHDESRRLLNRLGLNESFLTRKASELSVGQQQRVAAARALIGAPQLIIADEPTSALDSDSRHDFLTLLFEECEAAESTLIFVTHDTDLTSRFQRQLRLNEVNRAGAA